MNPLVSVIVPVYKVEKYLRNCLDSLVYQNLQDWEAILVDDGSPDHSGEICEEYAAKDNRFRVIHKKNGGLSSARNAALPEVKGTYIFFLDSDDFLHHNALKALSELAIKNNADIVQCNFVRGVDTIFPEISVGQNVKYNNHSIFTSFAAKIITCGKLYKTAIIGDIRFPEGLVNEDDFTTWKFYYRAKYIVVTNTPYYYYTTNPGSIMANQSRKPNLNYFNAYRERISFFQNTKEVDLEAASRVHWMKSLAMIYSNRNLGKNDKKLIRQLFSDNFGSESLKAISIPLQLKAVFYSFAIAPMFTSKIIKRLHKSGV